jgi:hypothetical protein
MIGRHYPNDLLMIIILKKYLIHRLALAYGIGALGLMTKFDSIL